MNEREGHDADDILFATHELVFELIYQRHETAIVQLDVIGMVELREVVWGPVVDALTEGQMDDVLAVSEVSLKGTRYAVLTRMIVVFGVNSLVSLVPGLTLLSLLSGTSGEWVEAHL